MHDSLFAGMIEFFAFGSKVWWFGNTFDLVQSSIDLCRAV